ncbi:MAG TPA: DUF2203 domain-containing protein [Gemmatimonadales bacterium]|nr:DUF2203 domain-containing protein [Gemmatimonadales bacterium]
MPAPRIFTVAEAERTLPLVRRIVTDLLAAYPVWRQAVEEYDLLAGAARAELGETPALQAARETITREAERINGYLQELEQIGCVFKGFEAGLVDFYALREDRLVFLCWRLGEDHITHWHEVDAGFAGRRPLDEVMLQETIA